MTMRSLYTQSCQPFFCSELDTNDLEGLSLELVARAVSIAMISRACAIEGDVCTIIIIMVIENLD